MISTKLQNLWRQKAYIYTPKIDGNFKDFISEIRSESILFSSSEDKGIYIE